MFLNTTLFDFYTRQHASGLFYLNISCKRKQFWNRGICFDREYHCWFPKKQHNTSRNNSSALEFRKRSDSTMICITKQCRSFTFALLREVPRRSALRFHSTHYIGIEQHHVRATHTHRLMTSAKLSRATFSATIWNIPLQRSCV